MPTTWIQRKENLLVRLAAFLAFASLMVVHLGPSQPRIWQESLGDFKLVYASAAALAETGHAYSFTELARVHRKNGVVVPVSWYGHSPVYPPFTLLALSPFLLLSMVHAAYLWAVLCYLAMAVASYRLAHYAHAVFGLPLAPQLLLISLMAASPLVSFGLELANASVVAAALCIIALTATERQSSWMCATELTCALLLKPHLAFWVVMALLLIPRRTYGNGEHRLALRTLSIFASVLFAMVVFLALRHEFFSLIRDYVGVLRAEASGGSMDVRAREIMMIPAHITSLGSLLGYWIYSLRVVPVVQFLILIPIAGLLLLATRRAGPHWKPIVLSAWITFGFLVTYHRAHDGTVLFLMLPWIFGRLRQRLADGAAWMVLGLYTIFSVDIPPAFYHWVGVNAHLLPVTEFLMYRQVALATLLLALTLVFLLLRHSGPSPDPTESGSNKTPELHALSSLG